MPKHEPTPQPNISLIAQRATLLRELRLFFDSRGFLEVQPPCLARECVVDPYIDPLTIPVEQFALGDETLAPQYFLQTSPELAMKRMLASGAPSIYSIGPVFRAGESGAHHNVEFTMLEWYEVGADLQAGVELLSQLASEMLGARTVKVVSYRQLFQNHLGLDPLDAALSDLTDALSDQQLAESFRESLGKPDERDRDDLLDVMLSQQIQPRMQRDPVIVTHYPLSQAALAKQSSDDPECASRFELFAGGLELANGYDELTDPEELLRRTDRANKKRAKTGRQSLVVPESLIHAMRVGLPDSAGVALGVDRLLMLRTGAESIDQVIPFTSKNA